VDELYPNLMSLSAIHKVLQKLLRENIPIRDLTTILETLTDYITVTKDPELLTEYVRFALNQSITKLFQADDGRIYCFTLEPELEELLSRELENTRDGRKLSLSPELFSRVIQQMKQYCEQLSANGHKNVLVTAPTIRPYLRKLTESTLPELHILSYGELVPTVELESIGGVGLGPGLEQESTEKALYE